MINETCNDLKFMHVVVFNQDEGLFALAREPISQKVHLFLIIGTEEKIYKRDGRANCWKLMGHEELSQVLQSICRAVSTGLTVLNINGKAQSVISNNN
jgi:hypothetical protein